jgi:aryl-alcohol dehydrogenase-like predicted oxidoreductase
MKIRRKSDMETVQQIQLRPLGKTDIFVSPIGLGVMEFAGGGGLTGSIFPVIPQEEKNAIVKAALDGGINWFDTAELYGAGMSERSWQPPCANGMSDRWSLPQMDAIYARRNIPHRSMRQATWMATASPIIWSTSLWFHTGIEMNAMADLVRREIRSVGISNFNPDRMRKAHAALAKRGLTLAVNQVRYNLLSREIEKNGVLETAKELGVTIIAYTPLGRGLLSGRYHKDPNQLKHLF